MSQFTTTSEMVEGKPAGMPPEVFSNRVRQLVNLRSALENAPFVETAGVGMDDAARPVGHADVAPAALDRLIGLLAGHDPALRVTRIAFERGDGAVVQTEADHVREAVASVASADLRAAFEHTGAD